MKNAIIILFVVLTFSACSKNPVTGERELRGISESAELQLGKEAKRAILKEYGLYANASVQAYVEEVGRKLVAVSERKNIPHEFVILDTPMVNAFAVPGVVFLTRGILDLMQDEAELAGVMGHELGHINGFHTVKILQKAFGYSFLATLATVAGIIYTPNLRDSQEYAAYYQTLYSGINLMVGGFLSGYGRDLELEADRSGLRYAILAGYDPDAMISFFKRMQNLEKSRDRDISIFLRTHPPTENRIAQAQEVLHQLEDGALVDKKNKNIRRQVVAKVSQVYHSSSTQFVDNFNRYQDTMRQASWPSDQMDYKISGRSYQHLALGLSVLAPVGWQVEAGFGRTLAQLYHTDGKARAELQVYRVRNAPQMMAQQSAGGMAGLAYSTSAFTAQDWAVSIVNNLGFGVLQKRTERQVTYPLGQGYSATYYGATRLGQAAFYKLFFWIKPLSGGENFGVVLIAFCNQESYLNYLVDFDFIFKNLRWKEDKN